ncbi:hypothetical protein V6Z12_D02G245500 [Gossypium hirsutum]
MRCGAFSLLFVSRYSIATVSNLTTTAVFTLTACKRTVHPGFIVFFYLLPCVRNSGLTTQVFSNGSYLRFIFTI